MGGRIEGIIELYNARHEFDEPSLPANKPSTTEQAKRELLDVRNAAADLKGAIDRLHAPALHSLQGGFYRILTYPELELTEVPFGTMKLALDAVLIQLKIVTKLASPEGTKKANRPTNWFCYTLSGMLMASYEQISCTSVTKGGEGVMPRQYVSFVKQVFASLDLTETASFFAKKVASDRRGAEARIVSEIRK